MTSHKEQPAAHAECKGENTKLRELLEEVRDRGLIYWEPNTPRGFDTKIAMLARISAALAPASGEATNG